ncbi:MAG: hypothetical protein HYV63_32810 [Candidatus Schekmanbacteria bacterium]|nr:hypothetical protein [Candidatus Schekmanbacteria bacterium]
MRKIASPRIRFRKLAGICSVLALLAGIPRVSAMSSVDPGTGGGGGGGGTSGSGSSATLQGATPGTDSLEAKMYAITVWTDTECDSEDSDLDRSPWDDMTQAWYDEITSSDHDIYFKDGSQVNGTFNQTLLCDTHSGYSDCADTSKLDDADAAIIATHGGDKDGHWRGRMRSNASGRTDCRVDAPDPNSGSDEDLFVGDSDLEFLHFSSCHSMDDDNIGNTYRYFYDSSTSSSRLHQANGFHGVMWIYSWEADNYEEFADDAYSVAISSAWQDNQYDGSVYDWENWEYVEQCPVSYAIGSTGDDCETRLLNEQYDWQYGDPEVQYTCYSYFDGCDPTDDDPFN